MIKQRIMYVCSECAEGCPEACGHYDRTELRVMPDGAWLCESCFDNNDDNEFLSWGHLPAPEEYGRIPASAQGAITGRPTHYRPLPKGVRCRCLKMWREADGGYWCCNPKDQATLDKAPAVSGSAEPLQCLRCGTVDAFGPVSKERQQHAKPLAALIQAIEAEARRYAEMYPQSSDGRNTFIIFADWVARLEAPSISEGERQSPILWCCHVRGPDDVFAAPDYETALAWSDAMNEINWRNERYPKPAGFQNPSSYDECLVKAAPAIWPHSPEAHAEDLPKSIAGFAPPSQHPSTMSSRQEG